MNLREFLASKPPPAPRCPKCGKGISHNEEPRQIDSEFVCEDCYFSALSDVLEQHPIGLPRGSRGQG